MVPGVKYNDLLLKFDKLKRDFVYQVNKKDEYFQELKYLEHENEKLKERNYQLATINDDLYKDNYLISKENAQLKDEIINLKTKLYDASVKEARLLKILNETSDYT